MRFIDFSRTFVGILFVIRTMHVFRGRAIAPRKTISACGLATLIGISLIGFWPSASALSSLLLTAVVALLNLFAVKLAERRKLTALRARVPLFVDKWILNLRLGASMVGARADALRGEDQNVRALLAPVFESTAGGRGRHLILSSGVMREFEQISRATHSGLERLETLRAHLQDESEFRRKSGQAVRQATLQSYVMLFMLVALAGYTIQRYGWSQTGDLITASAALSTLGAVVMVRLSRKGKWNL